MVQYGLIGYTGVPSAMTHNKLHPIIDRLEERQTAFQNRRGTAQPAHYLGHGGQLSLPDGRPYEAYLRGGADELKIAFVGPRLGSPALQAELGQVRLAIGSDGLWVAGTDVGYHS